MIPTVTSALRRTRRIAQHVAEQRGFLPKCQCQQNRNENGSEHARAKEIVLTQQIVSQRDAGQNVGARIDHKSLVHRYLRSSNKDPPRIAITGTPI